MATNYTTNYDLCQWESTDQVLRTDFNADNAKIDAALKANADAISVEAAARAAAVSAKADTSALNAETSARQAADNALAEKAGAQLIQRVTLTSATEWVHLDMSEIDWTQWATVAVCIRPVLVAGDEYLVYCNTAGLSITIPVTLSGEFLMCLLPFFSGSAPIRGLVIPGRSDNSYLCYDTACSALTELEIGAPDHNFQTGSVFEIWGNR